ncbi:hypothetical protein KIL84_021139 [Mauremys mutica]|uniref:Uncharacterized protein n=1 Tax=Mauremys mutica TaxID=74926 RepID=A0A9D3XC99_9SAUR|nr:hypothetical protein KIL84_021139 [Mauremys mutica]
MKRDREGQGRGKKGWTLWLYPPPSIEVFFVHRDVFLPGPAAASPAWSFQQVGRRECSFPAQEPPAPPAPLRKGTAPRHMRAWALATAPTAGPVWAKLGRVKLCQPEYQSPPADKAAGTPALAKLEEVEYLQAQASLA